jgi:hypothetical protein
MVQVLEDGVLIGERPGINFSGGVTVEDDSRWIAPSASRRS